MSLHLLEQGSTLSTSEGDAEPGTGPLRLCVLVPATAHKCSAKSPLLPKKSRENKCCNDLSAG